MGILLIHKGQMRRNYADSAADRGDRAGGGFQQEDSPTFSEAVAYRAGRSHVSRGWSSPQGGDIA